MRRRVGASLAAVIAAFLAVTLLALEGQEVVVLRTFDGNGIAEETRTWVADEDGFVWIESANPERPFYRKVMKNSYVELKRGGAVLSFTATPAANPDGHLRIRRLLAQKYGWADRWIGLLADTSESIALRLAPISRTVRP